MTSNDEWEKALIIVDECARCGDPITAADEPIYWDGEQVCQSCEAIALAAQKSKGR